MKDRTPRTEPKTVTDLLQLSRTSAELYGERNLYVYIENKEEKRLTYKEFYERLLWFGTALSEFDLAGKAVAVVGDTHPFYMTSFIGVIASNGTIVPLDKDLGDDALVDFMNVAGVSAVIYTEKFNNRLIHAKDRLPSVRYFIPIHDGTEDCTKENVVSYREMLNTGRSLYEAGNTSFTDAEQNLDHMAALIFTSGTTGTSKGVMLSHRNLVAAVNCSDQTMNHFNENSVFVDCLPMNHSYEISCGQLAIQNLGATMVINDSIKNVLRNFQKYKPNSLLLVPLYVETMYRKIWAEIDKKGMRRQVRALMKTSDALLKVGIDMRRQFFSQITDALGGNLKHIVVGGAPMRYDIIKDFRSFGIAILEGYGITECSPLVAVNRLGAERAHSVGPAVPCCQVKIDKVTENDETGEILVKGENVMMGYYNNPEATAEVMTEDGWFRTGDIGYTDKDGYIFITGRKKNVIILSNGKNVFPEELEEHLSVRSDVIAESVVIGRPNDSGEVAITAVIYPNPEFSAGKTSDEVREGVRRTVNEINKSLPVYKQIREIEIRDTEFEKTTTKKIKRFLVK